MNNITVVIPSSPCRKHPSTEMIERTIHSIRHHLPDAEIILQIDGIRKEQRYLTDCYNEYKSRLSWKCLHSYNNILPLFFNKHMHQSGMMHKTFKHIKTPLILYVEHDTPLVTDKDIDFEKCEKHIFSGDANTVRFHFEARVRDNEQSFMIGKPENDFLRTIKWSQRPFLTTKLYFENEVMKPYKKHDKKFIEDSFYGVLLGDYKKNKMLGWYKHRLWLYHPDRKDGIKFSTNLDGRGDERKY